MNRYPIKAPTREIGELTMSDDNKMIEEFKSYGYADDILPIPQEKRDWGMFNFITVWMGPVHNIMSYMTVAGFFVLGLNVTQVFWAVMLSALIVSAGYALNGIAAAKYGIPFAMLLRDSFGVKGSIIPALSRGLISGLVFFGTTTVVGAQAFNVIFTRIFPDYMSWGGGFNLFGLDFPTMLSYIVLWVITVLLFLTGMKVLSKFSAYSSPIVYVFIIGAAIWGIYVAGGIGPIMDYVPSQPMDNPLVFIACVSALVSNWAGPIVNISDFTQRAKSINAPKWGLPIGFIASYILFAITSIALIAGVEIAFGEQIFNVVDAIGKMGSTLAVIILLLALNLGATAFVVFGNLQPAGLQMTALFPKLFTVKSAGILTAVIGTIILPWKLVSDTTMLYLFYSFIGSMYGPIAGIMLASFYIQRKKVLNLRHMYVKPGDNGEFKSGYNKVAMIVLIISFLIPMSGVVFTNVPLLVTFKDFAFFTGLIISFILYTLFYKNSEKR